jgi:hypothetical protein
MTKYIHLIAVRLSGGLVRLMWTSLWCFNVLCEFNYLSDSNSTKCTSVYLHQLFSVAPIASYDNSGLSHNAQSLFAHKQQKVLSSAMTRSSGYNGYFSMFVHKFVEQ